MTLFASAQGVCLFTGYLGFTATSAVGFGAGVILCTTAVGVMASCRSPPHISDAPLMADHTDPLGDGSEADLTKENFIDTNPCKSD